ncbi:preprotein translocase subunit TatB [Streptomyces sp. H10-C2]|uniref:preprotein translocase subunit TatB n=1 Tax=unclassified Streptomyces TaxID=2593676 RepID=UPI0024B950CA|nr:MULTISPECIES: preprotein translocase subunit TatB [unclassified Streptomyces]MDJ0346476.1 preprotein translocase subunit TatB [Streptomyces sp. PH10-H1]MDJ0374990.1 preprotein translocase subunit TatB [Streptomyces sp. H10-C2]
MSKFACVATAVGAVALIGGIFAPSASATSSHPYSCSNQSVGVNCSGLITVNDTLNGTTVNVGGISALNGTQISGLQTALANVSDNNVNLPVTVQLSALETSTINTLAGYGITVLPVNVGVCAGSVCV